MFTVKKKIRKLSHFLKNKLLKSKISDQEFGDYPYLRDIISTASTVAKQKFTTVEEDDFTSLTAYHDSLKKSEEVIDFSMFKKDYKRVVSEIADNSASPVVWGQFYYKLTKRVKASNILEIGTNLGVSGQYFILALEKNNQAALFETMEGVEGLCKIADKRFKTLTENTQVKYKIHQGFYDDNLHKITESGTKFDIVFIDGNHRYEPTLKYYNTLKNNYSNEAIIIFDDINWNDEMQKAWKEIKNDKNVVYSVDFFKLGLILYQKGNNRKDKKHYGYYLSKK